MSKISQKEKSRFRSSSDWKDFRLQMLDECKGICGLCHRNIPSSKLNLHHKDTNSENYTNISNKAHFIMLCSCCHDAAHSFHTILKNPKNKNKNWLLFETIQHLFLWSEDILNLYRNSKNK